MQEQKSERERKPRKKREHKGAPLYLENGKINPMGILGLKVPFQVICKKAGAESISASVYDEMLKILKQYVRSLLKEGVIECMKNKHDDIHFEDMFKGAMELSKKQLQTNVMQPSNINQALLGSGE